MVIRINLSIPGKEKAKEDEYSYRHLLVFAAASLFFLASLVVLTVCCWKLVSLRSEKQELIRETTEINNTLDIMNIAYGKAVSSQQQYEQKMDFILDDVPTIEFLSSITPMITEEVSVESVKMTKIDAAVSGSAVNEEAILSFASAITESPYVESIALPEIKQSKTANGDKLFSYTFGLKLKPLKSIASDSVPPSAKPAEGPSVISGDM